MSASKKKSSSSASTPSAGSPSASSGALTPQTGGGGGGGGNAPPVGISLGSTYCCAAFFKVHPRGFFSFLSSSLLLLLSPHPHVFMFACVCVGWKKPGCAERGRGEGDTFLCGFHRQGNGQSITISIQRKGSIPFQPMYSCYCLLLLVCRDSCQEPVGAQQAKHFGGVHTPSGQKVSFSLSFSFFLFSFLQSL